METPSSTGRPVTSCAARRVGRRLARGGKVAAAVTEASAAVRCAGPVFDTRARHDCQETAGRRGTPGRRVAGIRWDAGEVRRRGRRDLPRHRDARRPRPLPRPPGRTVRSTPGEPNWPAFAKPNCGRRPRRSACATSGCSTTTTSTSTRCQARSSCRRLVRHVRRIRPDVVVTFGPDGAYGHPDHVAISQFTTAALVAAADSTFVAGEHPAHRTCEAVLHGVARARVGRLPGRVSRSWSSTVDGVERQAMPWPEWAITTVDRHARLLVHGLAGGLVPRVAGGRLRSA